MPTKTGYFRQARAQVHHHVDVFDDVDCDVAVAPSGSSVGSVYHQYAIVAGRCGDELLAWTAEPLNLVVLIMQRSTSTPHNKTHTSERCPPCIARSLIPWPTRWLGAHWRRPYRWRRFS